MSLAFIHKTLPDGAWKAKYESEFYRLIGRKRQMYTGNYEMKYNLRYLVFSKYARVFYERILDEEKEPEENIRYYIQCGILWMYPTGEQQEEIREDCKKENLGYWKLMFRRQQELDWDRQRRGKPTGNGDKYWAKYRREQIEKLKMKYKRKA